MDIVYIGEAFDSKPFQIRYDNSYIYVDLNSNNFTSRILFSHQEKVKVESYYKETIVYKSCFILKPPILILKNFIYLEYKTVESIFSHNLYYIQFDKAYLSKILFYIKNMVPIYDLYPYIRLLFIKTYLIDTIPDRLFPIFSNWKAFSLYTRKKKLLLTENIFL